MTQLPIDELLLDVSRRLNLGDRRSISKSDPRCAWMFAGSSSDIDRLGQLVDRLSTDGDLTGVARLVHFADYLDWLSELDVFDEIESLLSALGCTDSEIQAVVVVKKLPTKGSISNKMSASHLLSPHLEAKVGILKGAWAPASQHLVETARALCPTDTVSFSQALSLALAEPANTILAGTVLALQKLLGIAPGIDIRMMRVTAVGVVEGTSAGTIETEKTSVRQIIPSTDEGDGHSTDGNISIEAHLDHHAETPEESSPDATVDDGRMDAETVDTRGSHSRIESESVRSAVKQAIAIIDADRGICLVSDVIDHLKDGGITLSHDRFADILSRLDGFVLIQRDWIGITASSDSQRLTLFDRLLRKILAVVDPLPVEIVHAQLARNNGWFKQIPTTIIESRCLIGGYISKPNHFIASAIDMNLEPFRELEANEWKKWVWMIRHLQSGLSLTEPTQSTDIDTTKQRSEARYIRESPILVRANGGILPLRRDFTLFGKILESASFVQVLGKFEPADVQSPPLIVELMPAPEKEEVDGLSIIDQQVEELSSDSSWSEISEGSEGSEIMDRFEGPHDPNANSVVPEEFGSTTTAMVSLKELLGWVTNEKLVIPSIQRGYVWKPGQVKDLFDSLYRGYPIGTMLVWSNSESVAIRNLGRTEWIDPKLSKPQLLLLDGQQRLTSVYLAISSGRQNLYFNALAAGGTFTATSAARSYSARAIPLRGIHAETTESILRKCRVDPSQSGYNNIRSRIDRLVGLLQREVTVDTLNGFDYGAVTEIFVRVNSRGTKLKAAELAIAEVAYRIPGLVTDELSAYVDDLARRGWNFTVAFFIRLIAAEGTGRVAYSGLNIMTEDAIKASWKRVRTGTQVWLQHLRDDLGLIGDTVLPGLNPHILPIVWLASHDKKTVDPQLDYWFVLANVFARYTGTTDSNLDQDLRSIKVETPEELLSQVILHLRARRSSLRIEPLDVERAGQQSALLLLMYLADLSHAKSALLSLESNPESDTFGSDNIMPVQIIPNKSLRSIGYGDTDGKMKNGGLANLVFVARSFTESDRRENVLPVLSTLRQEIRYQHGVPAIPGSETYEMHFQFLAARARQLVLLFNDVLNDLESRSLKVRSIQDPSQSSASSGRAKFDFDPQRRSMFEDIRRHLLEIVPSLKEKETGTYLGFMLPRQTRPFASVALRRTMLNFTMDAHLDEIDDPRGWCRDVSKVSTHGIGQTSFVITQPNQIPYALSILEQVVERRGG